MKIFQYRGAHPNFGDELNGWLWPKLLPHFFDEDESTAFVGIGSTIGDVPRNAKKKIVFGAGYAPHYHVTPDMQDGSWDVRFVRGPRTAQRLNLAPEMAIGDSGILLRTVIDPKKKSHACVSFMPHWESMARGNWQAVCVRAGVELIDPRCPVEEVIAALLRSQLVIAEAMHGAIIADALRIPFVPVTPLNVVHRDKWLDWAESLGMVLRPQRLWPSSLTELSVDSLRGAAPFHPRVVQPSMLSRMKGRMQSSRVAPWIDDRLVDLAAHRLRKLAQVEGLLSVDAKMEEVTQRMQEKLAQLQRDYAA